MGRGRTETGKSARSDSVRGREGCEGVEGTVGEERVKRKVEEEHGEHVIAKHTIAHTSTGAQGPSEVPPRAEEAVTAAIGFLDHLFVSTPQPPLFPLLASVASASVMTFSPSDMAGLSSCDKGTTASLRTRAPAFSSPQPAYYQIILRPLQ